MKKYLAIIKIAFQRQLTFRADFLGFRLATLLEIGVQLIIWTVIFKSQEIIKGYTYEEMITYVLVGWLFLFVTHSYGFEDNIAKDIHLGKLSNFLFKPISYLKYITALSIGRVSIASTLGAVMIGLLIFLFHESIIGPSSFLNIIIIAIMVFFGYFIRLFLSIIVGFIAFWTIDISGLHYSANIIIKFLSGAYFPMNLLPNVFLNISLVFPFVYTFFYPTQLYLGKISTLEGLKGLGIELIWLFLLYAIIKIMWRRGLKKYEGVGI